MRNLRISLLLLSLGLWLGACNRAETVVNQCPPCPNNTECLEGDCGCPPDKHDMGSWCLSKHDNLFVAASLDCYCFGAVGLYLWNINPETGSGGGVQIPASSFSITGRGNSMGSNTGNFAYYDLPDGDSIAIYAVLIPDSNMPGISQNYCRINSEMACQADLFGKFLGPDTIQAQVVWRRCSDNDGEWLNSEEIKPLTFVRKR